MRVSGSWFGVSDKELEDYDFSLPDLHNEVYPTVGADT